MGTRMFLQIIFFTFANILTFFKLKQIQQNTLIMKIGFMMRNEHFIKRKLKVMNLIKSFERLN
jgi:hypothetical protein